MSCRKNGRQTSNRDTLKLISFGFGFACLIIPLITMMW
ncbi:hypothetical protein LINPERHAP2_LOCUS19211 [Linum perenne]